MDKNSNIETKLKQLAEFLHETYSKHIPKSPHHNYSYNWAVDGKVKKFTRTSDGYTCSFSPWYSYTFTKGRFGPDTDYSREARTLEDSVVTSVQSTDFHNGSNLEQDQTVTYEKKNSYTKDISLEVAFRLLISESAEANIEFVKAGAKYEYELSTKLDTKSSETHTDSEKISKTIRIPAHSDLRYDVIKETSTYRQRVHASGPMDFNVNIDVYNVFNMSWDSLESMQEFYAGESDNNSWLERYFQSNPINVDIPEDKLDIKLTMVIKSENAKTGKTSLTPIKPTE